MQTATLMDVIFDQSPLRQLHGTTRERQSHPRASDSQQGTGGAHGAQLSGRVGPRAVKYNIPTGSTDQAEDLGRT